MNEPNSHAQSPNTQHSPIEPEVVLITGGASGIGLAICRHFASLGKNVAILDVDVEQGADVAASMVADFRSAKVVFEQCDVSSWEDQAAVFERLYDRFGRIDIVVANAGISEQGGTSLTALDEAEPREPVLRTLDVNLVGAIYSDGDADPSEAVKLASHYIQKQKDSSVSRPRRGSIICTASNAGLYPFPVAPLYAASKAGIIGLVRSMARQLERVGIRINALAPAVLETNIAPSKALFEGMVLTPMPTLIRGVEKLVGSDMTGAVLEIHGDEVTVREHHDWVDENSRRNLENFWDLGYA